MFRSMDLYRILPFRLADRSAKTLGILRMTLAGYGIIARARYAANGCHRAGRGKAGRSERSESGLCN